MSVPYYLLYSMNDTVGKFATGGKSWEQYQAAETSCACVVDTGGK
jgi:hypothetical protein